VYHVQIRWQRVSGYIYKAKIANRPAKPAPAKPTEALPAAPVAVGEAAEPEPDTVEEPVGRTEVPAAVPVGLEEPVATAAELAALEAGEAPAPAGASTKAVWELGKRLLMQLSTHCEYFWVAAAEPSPWSHLAAHSLVSMAWEALGRALPRHAAWQLTSPALQARAQLTAGVRPVGTGAAEAGALVVAASWGMATAPMAKRRMVENFMVAVAVVR